MNDYRCCIVAFSPSRQTNNKLHVHPPPPKNVYIVRRSKQRKQYLKSNVRNKIFSENYLTTCKIKKRTWK